MVREAKISQEEVNAAADKIRAAGVKPAARSVREAMGRGSMGTILKFLQVWQSGQMQAPGAVTILPATLQRALVEFIGQEVASAKAALESDMVTIQQSNADLIAESERQDVSIETQLQDIDTLQATNAELAGRLTQLSADLDESRNDAQSQRLAAEWARTEKAKTELRLEGVPRLEAEIDRLRAALESEHVARVKAEQIAAVAAATLAKTDEQVADLQQRLGAEEADTRAARKDVDALRAQVQALQASLVAAVQPPAPALGPATPASPGPEPIPAAITDPISTLPPSKSTGLMASQLDDC